MLTNMRVPSTLRTPMSLTLPMRHKSKSLSTPATRSPAGQRRRAPNNVSVVASLPALLPLAAKAVTAGILFYASMNWVFYRGTRKDVEKANENRKETEAPKREARKKMVEKLTRGRAVSSDDDDDNTKRDW